MKLMDRPSGMERAIQRIIRVAVWISCFGLVGITLVFVIDVCMRSVLNLPLPGTMEIVKVLMVLVIFFALAYTAVEKEHVSIDLVVSRLPRRIQAILDSFASLLGVLVLAVISWQLGARAWENFVGTNPMHSSRLLIPYAPFLLIAALGCIPFCAYLLWSFLRHMRSALRK